jgi:tRNA (guanine10-N2)-methyltransferase
MPPGVIRAATQYGTARRIVDLCTFDVTRHPWRCGGLFDAIVTDPPCKKEGSPFSSLLRTYFLSDGVRAGAKRIGRKKELSPSRFAELVEQWKLPRCVAWFRVVFFFANCSCSDDQPYIPPTKPYEFSHLAIDLVLLARYLLKPGGRLVFFVPTVTDEYEEIDIDQMLCDGMKIVANSLQDFGSWGRRVSDWFHSNIDITHWQQLVTISKTTTSDYPPPVFQPQEPANTTESIHVPAHKDFREKYFQGFKKDSGHPT